MSDIIKELTDLKKKIENAKSLRDKAEGKLSVLMTQLKDDFDCKTVESASKKLEKMGIDLDKQETELEEKKEKLIANYGGLN